MSSSSAATAADEIPRHIRDTYSNKVVLITGATGGLGKALTFQCLQWNVKRLIVSGRTESSLQALVQECHALNPAIPVDSLVCDLSQPDSIQQALQSPVLFDEKKEFPVVDILINNGGVSSRSRFVDTDWQVDAKVMQINFLAGAAFCKAVVPGMIHRGRGGKILWISSLQGLLGIPNRSSYAASKFAVQGYTESIRSELQSSHNITVHTISPGYIQTGLSTNALQGDGSLYGQMDPTTAAGADPRQVAVELLSRVAKGEVDFTIAATTTALIGYALKFFCPSLLRYLLVKRYEKSVSITNTTTNASSNDEDDSKSNKKNE